MPQISEDEFEPRSQAEKYGSILFFSFSRELQPLKQRARHRKSGFIIPLKNVKDLSPNVN